MLLVISSKQHCGVLSLGHSALDIVPVTVGSCVDRCILFMARLGQ